MGQVWSLRLSLLLGCGDLNLRRGARDTAAGTWPVELLDEAFAATSFRHDLKPPLELGFAARPAADDNR